MSIEAPLRAHLSERGPSLCAAARLSADAVLILSNDGGAPAVEIVRAADETVCLTQLLREHLAACDEETRQQIITTCAHASPSLTRELSGSLHQIREALRRRLPSQEDPSARRGLQCEGIVATSDGCYGIWGWVCDLDAPAVQLVAISPEGARIDLTPHMSWHTHAQADAVRTRTDRTTRSGFFCHFTAPSSPAKHGWLIEMQSATGLALESRAPQVVTEPDGVSQAVLEQLMLRGSDVELIKAHIHPILSRLQAGAICNGRAAGARDFGSVNANANVSIIIPVFERPDLIEQQLAAFATDAALIEGAQLIYVLDSPWMADEFAQRGAEWFERYRVPFRLVTMDRRAGFAGACRVGIASAHSRSLLFMHSDVLPSETGWLTTMLRFQESNPSAGAIGCQLVYSDGAIQHRGLLFARKGNDWRVRSPLKGLSAKVVDEQQPRAVPAISAACVLVDRALYDQVGGFSGEYLAGEHEDADLSLRLAQAGRTNWYLPSVSLHHLEGQSRSKLLIDSAAGYNAWLFNARCGAMLDAMSQQGGGE